MLVYNSHGVNFVPQSGKQEVYQNVTIIDFSSFGENSVVELNVQKASVGLYTRFTGKNLFASN